MPIVSWYENPRDTALDVLLGFLSKLNELDDVRPMLQQTFHISAALNNYLTTIPSEPAADYAEIRKNPTSAQAPMEVNAPSTGAPKHLLPPSHEAPSVIHNEERKDAVTPSRPISVAEVRPPLTDVQLAARAT